MVKWVWPCPDECIKTSVGFKIISASQPKCFRTAQQQESNTDIVPFHERRIPSESFVNQIFRTHPNLPSVCNNTLVSRTGSTDDETEVQSAETMDKPNTMYIRKRKARM